jgi:hypothetical protein
MMVALLLYTLCGRHLLVAPDRQGERGAGGLHGDSGARCARPSRSSAAAILSPLFVRVLMLSERAGRGARRHQDQGECVQAQGDELGAAPAAKLRRPRMCRNRRRSANFTDPESRILKTKDGYIQGYNAQAAVDRRRRSSWLRNNGTDINLRRHHLFHGPSPGPMPQSSAQGDYDIRRSGRRRSGRGNVTNPIDRVVPPVRPDSIWLNRERCGVALRLSPQRRGEAAPARSDRKLPLSLGKLC